MLRMVYEPRRTLNTFKKLQIFYLMYRIGMILG